MEQSMIQLAEQFSPRPYGRYPEHGPDNGTRFRTDFLEPALRAGQSILIDLDGARGLGPSFLEEAFGGLVRAGFTPDRLRSLISIKSDNDPSYIAEIWAYVEDAGRLAVH